MIRIDIEKIVIDLKNELKIWDKKWYFSSWKNKILFKDLEKLIFWMIIIWWNEIRFLRENKKIFLWDYNWIYKSESSLIKDIKDKFMNKILEKISFCPFCWKTSLIKFEKWRIFDLDHIFPKSVKVDKKWNFKIKVYHHLVINLYNLIPCCKWCNFIKSNKNYLQEWKNIFHPYFWFINPINQQNALAFCEEETLDSKYSFTLNDNNKRNLIFNKPHSDFFQLGKIYLKSQDTFNIFNFIQDKRTKIKDELNNFKVNLDNLTDDEKKDKLSKYKNYFFKNYYPKNEQDILKFSNWKLKKDLIDNLNI